MGICRKRFIKPNHWSPHHSSWGNPSLPYFRSLPISQVWASIGNKMLQDIMPAGLLLPFQDLSSMYRLPRWMHFHYLQLTGAAQFQFPHPPVLETDPSENLALLCVYSSKIDKLWGQWRADILTLDLEDCLEGYSKLVISSRDKLIHTKFLHRVYFTLQRLHRLQLLFEGSWYIFSCVLGLPQVDAILARDL